MNIAQHIERGRRMFPDKPALLFEGHTITYQDLDQQANRCANGLRALGLQRGDRVALFLPNIPEFVIAYLGTLKLGAIAVSLNAMLKHDEIMPILRDCSPKAIVTTAELRATLADIELDPLPHILVAEGATSHDRSFDQLMADAAPEADALEMQWDDPAAIVYTSGTTGFPKGATLSHGNVFTCMSLKNRYCDTRPDDRLLLFLPLFHCFGQNAILNNALNVGATLVLQRRFDPVQALSAVSSERITMFFGVPTVFIKLINLEDAHLQLGSVRYYFSAAATMPEEIARRWYQKYGIMIHEGYGLTETSPFASYNHHLKYKFGSIGMPIDGVEMKIVDQAGYEVAPGEPGEIIIRGPNVMLGYWNRPVETAQVLRDGWFHTGDIGTMDQEGYFQIVDRLKDMINVAGFKVYPAEVENTIYQHSAVAEVAVYGVPDAVQGEIVKAAIVLKPGHFPDEKEITLFCRERLANFKAPRAVEFVESLPKNGTGKILKRLLVEQAVMQPQVELVG
jgi:long-chain acyl-CoA synthetase